MKVKTLENLVIDGRYVHAGEIIEIDDGQSLIARSLAEEIPDKAPAKSKPEPATATKAEKAGKQPSKPKTANKGSK